MKDSCVSRNLGDRVLGSTGTPWFLGKMTFPPCRHPCTGTSGHLDSVRRGGSLPVVFSHYHTGQLLYQLYGRIYAGEHSHLTVKDLVSL